MILDWDCVANAIKICEIKLGSQGWESSFFCVGVKVTGFHQSSIKLQESSMDNTFETVTSNCPYRSADFDKKRVQT